jgi:Tfp pilus assembly protein PilX
MKSQLRGRISGAVRLVKNDQSGAALIIAIMMLFGLAAMGAAAVMLSSTDAVVAGNDRRYRAALDVAEAGVSEAMHRLSLRPGTMVTVGGNQMDASIRDASNPPDVNWQARIYGGNNPPASSGSIFNTVSVQDANDALDYTDASDPNRAITIRHKTRDFDGNGTNEVVLYDAGLIPPENPFTGFPVEQVLVTGRSGRASRRVMVEAIRFPINPNVQSALMCDGFVDLRGTVTVCGHNHRMDTPVGTQRPACSPAWDDVDGHLHAVMTTGGPVTTSGSVDLLGSPTATSVDAGNPFPSLAEALGLSQDELQDMLDNADRYDLSSGPPWDGITVINGDITINGGSGTGLLYVNGDLDLRGNFAWRGLVYSEGNLSNDGNTWILGAMVARGRANGGVDFSAGTPTVLYSRDMLNFALTAAMDYIVLSWKEI